MENRDILLTCEGGTVMLPPKPLQGRRDGGHLLVNPSREVWERGELTPVELTQWSFLVAAAGTAMLEVLPQLRGGCLNYWEAGNWALHDLAAPAGPKHPREHRRVHLHLFGRSPGADHKDWQWGESPRFPAFVASGDWSAQFDRFDPDECAAISARTALLLAGKYGMAVHC